MKISVLASGSSGNCVYIESNGCRLLIDAGISAKQVKERLGLIGRDIADVGASLITHEHSDHIRGIGVLERKHNIKPYMTEGTFINAHYLIGSNNIEIFSPNKIAYENGIRVESFLKQHDANEPVGFIVDDGKKRLGVITDLGCYDKRVEKAMRELDAVVIEANHDKEMLAEGPYPYFLKRRIAGNGGHLSNEEAARLVRDNADEKLKHIFLAHLSETNNTPQKALETFKKEIKERKNIKAKLYACSRQHPTELISI